MTDFERRLEIPRRLREEILALQDVRAESAGAVKLHQSQTDACFCNSTTLAQGISQRQLWRKAMLRNVRSR